MMCLFGKVFLVFFLYLLFKNYKKMNFWRRDREGAEENLENQKSTRHFN